MQNFVKLRIHHFLVHCNRILCSIMGSLSLLKVSLRHVAESTAAHSCKEARVSSPYIIIKDACRMWSYMTISLFSLSFPLTSFLFSPFLPSFPSSFPLAPLLPHYLFVCLFIARLSLFWTYLMFFLDINFPIWKL